VGVYGLQVLVDNNFNIFVQDDSPNAEPSYRVRFYFDPNSMAIAVDNYHAIFAAQSGTTDVLRIDQIYRSGVGYGLRQAAREDGSSTWLNDDEYPIGDAPHWVEIEWRAATAPEAIDGVVAMRIDGLEPDYDTGTQWIDSVRLGAFEGIVSTIRGTLYFDGFASPRQSYISPVSSISTTSTATGTPQRLLPRRR
jgi:hypothetical protein